MNLFNKGNVAILRIASFFKLIRSLFGFFNNDVGLDIKKLSVFIFASKYINMIVMFIPIKLLFILSGAKNIPFLIDIERTLGEKLYIFSLLLIVTVLYFVDMLAKVYKSKLINKQKEHIKSGQYLFQDKKVTKQIVLRTYSPYCQVISDCFVILASVFIFICLSPYYAIYYSFIVISYFIILEYLLFSPHQTRLLKKLSIDNNQFIQVCNGLLYLVFFFGIIVVLFLHSMHILIAILILLVARMSTTSLRTIFTSQKALRRDFFS